MPATETPFNVLLTCAGRRNYLVSFFRAALADAGLSGDVYVADASSEAPAMLEADDEHARTVPPVDDPRYFDALLRLCEEKSVRLLVPLNDFELPGLARQAERFRAIGTEPVVSPPEIVDLCFDKWATVTRLHEFGVPTAETRLGLEPAKAALREGALVFPLVVKPRWGTASIGVELVRDEAELELAYAWLERRLDSTAIGRAGDAPRSERILVQQALTGPEYGIDIVNGLDRAPAAVFVKRKIAMRAGETDRAVTEAEESVASLARRLSNELRPRGLTDCDAFLTPQGPKILELNPRFGGGYPFSHAAGANVPAALIAWRRGQAPKPEWLRVRPGVFSAKYDLLATRG